MQFELFESPTATIGQEEKKKSGPNTMVSNTTWYFLTYPLKGDVLFGG